MNIYQHLLVPAQLFPEHDAVLFEGRSYDYRKLEELAQRAAQQLSDGGIQHGDRVALMIPNVPAFVVWYYASLRLGAIVVSVNTRLAAEEVTFIVSDCAAKTVVTTAELAARCVDQLPDCVQNVLTVSNDARRCDDKPLAKVPKIDQPVTQVEPDDPATILYTSGTTGFPKGATLSHRNIRATVHAFNHLCGMQHQDRLLLAVPLFHCYGQNALLNSGFNVGATMVLQQGFDLQQSRQLIREHRITKLFGVPTTFHLMLDACEAAELSSIEYCFSAAATLPIQVSHQWVEKFGMPIYEGYGLTETSPFASYNHRLKYVPGSLGTPVDLVEMKVVNPDSGATCPPGKPGEIAIRGPNVMLGYWNRPEETAAAIRDGWFHSGDIGRMDEQGYFYIVDRLKDMICVGAQKVFPAEVERVLLDHPAIAETAVVGFPDEVMGERVVAFVVQASPATATVEQIREHCREHMAPFKVPSIVEFVPELPRNPAGKVLKRELRQAQLRTPENGPLPAPAPITPDPLPDRFDANAPGLVLLLRTTHAANRVSVATWHLQRLVGDLMNLDAPPNDLATLIELGMESLMMVELRDRLQRQVGPELALSATFVFDYPTIGELARYVVNSLEEIHQWSAQLEAGRGSAGTAIPPRAVNEMSEEMALEALWRELDE